MEIVLLMNKGIKITDIPEDKNVEDFTEDTEFILDVHDSMADDRYWNDESNE